MTHGLRVLFVEDSEDDAILVEKTLKAGGYDVDVLRVDTEEAFRQALHDQPWDLVLSDFHLPTFDARATLKVVGETGCDVPVLVVSGTVGEDVAVETLKLGAEDYLLKQNLTRLAPAVGRALDRAENRRQRRQKEAALREERDFSNTVLDSLPGVFYHFDDRLRFVRWNKNLERVTGYSAEEIAAMHPLDFFGDDEKALVASRIGEVFEKGESQVEASFLTKHGRRIPHVFTGRRIDYNGRQGCVGVGLDIDERKRMEEALRKETAMFEAQVESTLDGIVVVDLHGKKVIQNQRLNELWSIPPDVAEDPDSAHQIAFALTRAKDRALLSAHIARLDAHPADVMRDEMELVDGTILDFYTAPVLGKEGHCYGRIWSFRDITEQRRAEEQKAALEAQLRQNQKLEALGTLAGGIAHDFNNILTAIIGNQTLALMDLRDPDALRPLLNEIGQASSRAKALVSQILTFSRRQKPERQRQPLLTIVSEALSLVRASLPATIEIHQDLSPDAPSVLADSGQIHQVVLNLCTNAAHSMREGRGRLTVRLAPRVFDKAASQAFSDLPPGRYAQLTIADTGHGMEPAVLARIFEPFFTTKSPGEGTGLGLAMVHGIVRDHEGSITVRSEPGVGTTFELYFPEGTEMDTPVQADDTNRVSGGGERILVVDDEPAVGRAIGSMLRRIGYTVEVLADPREALERLRDTSAVFHLLLTDRTMPYLPGPELVRQAHLYRPRLPALVMSGLNSPSAEAQSVSGRRYGQLAKPIGIGELSRAVRQALDAARR